MWFFNDKKPNSIKPTKYWEFCLLPKPDHSSNTVKAVASVARFMNWVIGKIPAM